MTPIEFITDAAAGDSNTPAIKISDALQSELIINSKNNCWEITSYYYDPLCGAMVIDIVKSPGYRER